MKLRSYPCKHWPYFFWHVGILILSFQTLSYWPFLYKHWTYDLILGSVGILALFLYTLEFLFYPCRSWYSLNSGAVLINIVEFLCCPSTAIIGIVGLHPSTHSNSGLIFAHSGIPILSFQTLEFWLYFYTLILSFKTLGFWPYFYKHWKYDLILANTGFLALFLYTLEFVILSFQRLVFLPIFISIGILIFFLQTLEFSSYPSKQWNSGPFF